MLSILIPTYNYDCYELVADLHEQALNLDIPFEILVADDGSTDERTKISNRNINFLTNCRFIESTTNLGRSRNRNLLADNAKYEYLLFLDSDIKPCYKTFVSNYIDNISGDTVICGTTRFPEEVPKADKMLRYTYGITQEEKSAEFCNKKPHSQFTSISFLIRKTIFMKIRFNELFRKYGHEDTLFGKELEHANIPVKYIENPIFHYVPDSNEEFLCKTNSSIENTLRYRDLLTSHVRLLRTYNKVKKYGLHIPLFYCYLISKKILLKNLLGPKPNMKLFAFYKLCYISYLDAKGLDNLISDTQ